MTVGLAAPCELREASAASRLRVLGCAPTQACPGPTRYIFTQNILGKFPWKAPADSAGGAAGGPRPLSLPSQPCVPSPRSCPTPQELRPIPRTPRNLPTRRRRATAPSSRARRPPPWR